MFHDSTIANDNAPRGSFSTNGTAPAMDMTPRHRHVTERPAMVLSRRANAADYSPVWQTLEPADKDKASLGYLAAAGTWIAAIGANIWAVASAPINSIHLVIVLAAIWASLWMVYAAHKRGKDTLVEMASFAALTSFALALYVTSMRFGIFMTPVTGAGLTAFAALGLSFATGSRLCLRASAILGMVWAGYGFVSEGLKPFLWGFPALWSLQIYAATRMKDRVSIWLSALSGYVWVIGTLGLSVISGVITPLMGAAALLVTGAVHYRAGKLFQDVKGYAGLAHTNWGWTAAIAGAIGLQDFWLSPLRAPWAGMPNQVSGAGIWMAGIVIALICILAIDVRRVKTKPQSGFIPLAVTALTAALAFSATQYLALSNGLAGLGIDAMPMVGLILGGGVVAMAAAMILNGIRRGVILMVTLGLLAIGAQFVVGLDAILSSPENAAVFGVSAFVLALVTSLFAGTSE